MMEIRGSKESSVDHISSYLDVEVVVGNRALSGKGKVLKM